METCDGDALHVMCLGSSNLPRVPKAGGGETSPSISDNYDARKCFKSSTNWGETRQARSNYVFTLSADRVDHVWPPTVWQTR